MIERYVDADGVRTRCLSVGSGSPIILLHGFHGSADHYRWLGPELAPHFTVHAIDLLGHGHTDWPDRSYSIGDFGRHLIATLDALELDRTIVLGNSLGGAVAIWVAINVPDRVDRLVLLSPAGLGGATHLGALQFLLGYLEVAAGVRTETVAALSRRIQFSDPDQVDHTFFETKTADAWRRRHGHHRRITLQQSARLARLESVDPSLVRQPTLIIWGDDDRALSWRRAKPAIDGFADARLEVLPRAGHLPHVERPDEVARLTTGFLVPASE